MRFRPRVVAVTTALVLTACGGGDGGEPATGGGAGGEVLAVTGTDDLKFDRTELAAQAGTITVELSCGNAVNHNFVVEEVGDQVVAACDPGQTDQGTIDLEPGSYTFYCSVPGHRTAGMEGTLTVE